MGDSLPTVALGDDFIPHSIASGGYHSCVIGSNSTSNYVVKCWGRNDYGQLGLGDTDNRGDESDEMGNELSSVNLGADFEAVEMSLGHGHSCFLSTSGNVKCVGQGV